MKKKLTFAAIALSLVAGSAFAQKSYVSGAVGSASSGISCEGTITCDTRDTGVKLVLGHMLNETFAFEVGYMGLGEVKARLEDSGLTGTVGIKSWGFTLGAAAFMPIASQVTGFARGGLYFGRAKTSVTIDGLGSGSDTKSGTTPYVGLGIGYAVTKAISIDASVDFTKVKYSDGDSDRATLVTLGARYSF